VNPAGHGKENAVTMRRTNEDWLAALCGPERDEALIDLRGLLVRSLKYGLAGWSGVDEATVDDLTQDALLKILDRLDSFRGESHFTTWARKIAINAAFTELRRRRWRDVSLDEMIELAETDFIPKRLADPAADTEKQATQRILLSALRQIIAEELTDRQRQALVAVYIHAIPLEEVARGMGTNRNALYKLLHDARLRLKKRITLKGLPPQDFLAAFSP
jgi:RNA polymerase sigma-70 factor (ECF subfamily)